jgi:hypothetical protein
MINFLIAEDDTSLSGIRSGVKGDSRAGTKNILPCHPFDKLRTSFEPQARNP